MEVLLCLFFFNDTATTEIYTSLHTLSLHDALPICHRRRHRLQPRGIRRDRAARPRRLARDRTEEHTSELQSRNDNSYAGLCTKKKKQHTTVYQSIRSPRSQRKSSLLPLV